MSGARRFIGATKGRFVRNSGSAAAWALRHSRRGTLKPGVTVVTVNWNSLPYLRVMLDAIRAMSPSDTEILVVDNGSHDGSVEFLRSRSDVRMLKLPVNVGHGIGLDLGAAMVRTEYIAVLDIDAFPVSPTWLSESIAALEAGAQITGARMHRNFIHPCFLVTRTSLLRDYDLTFRPVGSLSRLSTTAPLFLDVAEAMAQRAIVKFGGGSALHPFEITSSLGGEVDGAVFGELVYHNMFATQGSGRDRALGNWRDAVARYHPNLVEKVDGDST